MKKNSLNYARLSCLKTVTRKRTKGIETEPPVDIEAQACEPFGKAKGGLGN